MAHGVRYGDTRPAAVAGLFYEAEPEALRSEVDAILSSAGPRSPEPMTGVIVPHAGHIYSGPVAATAYRLLPLQVDRVLLIGPSHFVALRAMAASGARGWETPLGEVRVDTAEVERLLAQFPKTLTVDDEAHSREHCLEVQLPFLQRVLEPGWTLVPIEVGHAPADDVAALIGDALSQPPRTILVVSTDLSHYLPYDAAASADRRTADAVVALDTARISDDDACGAYALRGAVRFAHNLGLGIAEVAVRSSGDTYGSRDRVVGYGTFVIAARAARADPGRKARLLSLARRTIAEALRTGRQSIPTPLAIDPDLRDPGAAFVTLRSGSTGELLGCVGSMEPYRALGVDVAAHALDAAFHDRRFTPLTALGAQEMRIGICVVGRLKPFSADGYADLIERIPAGRGVYVCAGSHRATYLPGVWRELPASAAFIASLWEKAGLVPGDWPTGIRVSTYDVEEFGED